MTTISWPEEIAKQLGLLESWVDWFDIMEKIDEYKAVADVARELCYSEAKSCGCVRCKLAKALEELDGR